MTEKKAGITVFTGMANNSLEYLIVKELINYNDFESIVILALDNFGFGTVDLLIEALQRYKELEQQIINSMESSDD